MRVAMNVVLALAVSAGSAMAQEQEQTPARHEAVSPNGLNIISLELGPMGEPRYTVTAGVHTIVQESPLGLELAQGGYLGRGMTIVQEQSRSIDESYALPFGKTKAARNQCQERTIVLEEFAGSKRRMEIVLRAYDDGVALRYVLPEQEALSGVEVLSEQTHFRFIENHRAWALRLRSFTTSNEREFDAIRLTAIKPEDLIGPPLTIEIDRGPFVAIAEAALKGYSGLHLSRAENEWVRNPTLVSRLAPPISGDGPSVKASLPMTTPWRVIMIGDRPGDLIESTLIYDLNEPSAVADTSWIKPGKAAWDWWNGPVIPEATSPVGMNTKTFEHFIDFAAEMGLEYMLIDAGWYGDHRDPTADITQPIPEMDLPGLIDYARVRNVGILLWLNWQNVRDQMDKAFPLYEEWGIKGVKIDYMDRKDQEIVDFYQRTLEATARHHLTVNFHGAYAGSGEERTWPHLLTREGVMGLEYLKWSDRTTPDHNVTLPYTRMLLGPMDFTPGGFRNVTRAEFQPRNFAPLVMGTRAHHLAMYVVYESGIQMLSDTPRAYRDEPGAELLKDVPTTWDETRVLAGRIGEYILIARRSGQDWFLGAMTNHDPRVLTVPLKFLGEGQFRARKYVDGRDVGRVPTQLTISAEDVAPDQSIRLELAGDGGAVVHLIRQ